MKVHILNGNLEVCFNKISIDVYIIGTYVYIYIYIYIFKSNTCLSLNTKKGNLPSFEIVCVELDDIGEMN